MSWSPGETLEVVESKVIIACLRFFDYNRSKTAESLGISLRTLETKIKTYNFTALIRSEKENLKFKALKEECQDGNAN